MTEFRFADRYAEAALSPGSAIIAAREASAERIRKELSQDQLLTLTSAYFGQPDADLEWFAEQFRKEDPSFSLVGNQRETLILAALILGAQLINGDNQTILAILAGSIGGKRQPAEAAWLVSDAKTAFIHRAIALRKPPAVDTRLKLHTTPKLGDELNSISGNDWATLTAVLGKLRSEEQDAAKAIVTQATAALNGLVNHVALLHEETQILWWLYGEASTTLNRPFKSLSPGALALVAGIELVDLSTKSWLGPAAGPVLLERVLQLSAPSKKSEEAIGDILDRFDPVELELLRTNRGTRPARLFPIMTAVEKCKEIGAGSWHAAYEKIAGLSVKEVFTPSALATQVYTEYLLGRFQ